MFVINKIKLSKIINSYNANILTRAEIKRLTSEYSKSEVLKHKKQVFKKIVKKTSHTIEGNKKIKRIAFEFKLTFNRQANQLVNEHLKHTKIFNSKLVAIDFDEIPLGKKETTYFKQFNGFFFDIPHIKNFDYKKFKYLILTNKRLILVFGKNKNSYYFTDHTFTNVTKFILVKDIKKKKPGIFLYIKNNKELLLLIKRLISEGE